MFLFLVSLLTPLAAASKCCLCDECVKPAEGLFSADFASGEVGCNVLNERIQALENEDQCNVHVMAHRENCCGNHDDHTTNKQLRSLQTGNNNPTCQLCYDNNPPECPGRAIVMQEIFWPEPIYTCGQIHQMGLNGQITTQWCNPLRACFQDWCCSPCPAPTPWTATTPADSPNPPTTFAYEGWESTQESEQLNDDPLQGICYNSPTGPSPSGGGEPSGGGGGGSTTDQDNTTGGTNCFSGNGVVDVLGKGKIYMAHLEIGDLVRTHMEKYTRVFSFAHWDPTVRASFLAIEAGPDTIEVSADHIIHANGKAVRASRVKVGDVLIGESQQSLTVSHIKIVERRGVYAPATESGDLIVNGILASNYVALIPGETLILSQNTLSHMLLSPVRMYCRWNFEHCEKETYTTGISDKYWPLLQLVLTSNTWSATTQFWVSVLALPFVLFFWICEQVLLSWCSVAIAACGAWIILRRRAPTKTAM